MKAGQSMRRLVLVRHAKTEKESNSGKDKDRRLDKRGLSDGALITTWLSENHITPDLALVSTATRTRQTWDILSEAFPKCETDLRDDLYLASAIQIVRTIQKTAPRIKTLTIIGHNPGLHEVAWKLSGKATVADRSALAANLPTAAIAVITFPITDWKNLMHEEGTLSHFITPKQLKHESDN
jgi:phosphohistidine phosphatase